MKNPATFLAAASALAFAAPAAAQYPYPQQYPQQGYPVQTYPYPGQQYGYGQQGYSTGNPVTDIIDQLLGNRYNVTDRQAVRQCARAAMSQASAQYGGGYGGYGNYNRYGYNQQQYGSFRVTAITGVERRSNGLRVTGLLGPGGRYGGYGNQGYNGYNGYAGASGDLSFRCNVDYAGNVTGVRVRPNEGYRRY
jgi:hypothetical protein